MKPIIGEIVDFVETGTAAGSFNDVLKKVDARELRIMAICLLEWLKASARSRRHRPLVCDTRHDWFQTFLNVLSNLSQLAELFEVHENRIDFRNSITADERNEIVAFVDSHHTPPLTVTYRR